MLAVYIPCKDKREAAHIAAKLLDQKLIACANIFPSTSMYVWQGKKEETEEFIIFAKTISEKFSLIQKEVRKLHSYDCPCITAWKIDFADKDYEKWVKESLLRGDAKLLHKEIENNKKIIVPKRYIHASIEEVVKK